MPNTAQKHSGKSLRNRIDAAAKLSAEQSKSARASSSARSASKRKQKAQPRDRRGSANAPASKAAHAGRFAGKRRVAAIVAAALVLLVVALYPVAQTYYQSMRQSQRLEAQVAAVNERNDSLEQKNDDLKTDEGIEDAAREQGYVKEGDKAAVVTNSGQSSAQSSEIPDKVDTDSIEAPHTWYYDILDVIFFVQYE